jgi:hypothetical protein
MQLWVYRTDDRRVVIALERLDPSKPVTLEPYVPADLPAESFLNRVLLVLKAAERGNLRLVEYLVPAYVPATVLVGLQRQSLFDAAVHHRAVREYLAAHSGGHYFECDF